MPSVFETSTTATPITFVTKSSWDAVREALPPAQRQFATASAFAAKPGGYLALPAPDGAIAQVLFGLEDDGARSRDPFRPGALPGLLPPGTYRFANAPHDARLAALAFALGSYRFARYRKVDRPDVRLVPPDGVDPAEIDRMADPASWHATSSTRHPTTWGRRNWPRPRKSSPPSPARATPALSART